MTRRIFSSSAGGTLFGGFNNGVEEDFSKNSKSSNEICDDDEGETGRAAATTTPAEVDNDKSEKVVSKFETGGATCFCNCFRVTLSLKIEQIITLNLIYLNSLESESLVPSHFPCKCSVADLPSS